MVQEGNDFFTGYIEEVQTYIPIIKKGVEELQTAPNKRGPFDEVYRLVHIIKGASSMVGINGLSQIAGCMETALEKIQEGQLALSAEAIAAMQTTADRFDLYCQGLSQGVVVDEETLLAETMIDFGKIGPGSGAMFAPEEASVLFGGEEIPLTDSLTSSPDEELLDEFRAEAEEHLEGLHQAMQYLEAHITGPVEFTDELRETVRKVRRSVHTIKGASAVIGLPEIAAYGHLVEDVLDWLYESATTIDPQLVVLLSTAFDLLATMIYTPVSFDEQQAEEVLAQLHDRMEATGERGGDTFSVEDDFVNESVPGDFLEPDLIPEKESEEKGGSLQGSLFSEEEKQILREGFLEEADEHLQQLHQSMRIFETAIDAEMELTPEHREEVRKIRRSVHTIKGASAVIGLSEVSSYAHEVEDFLDWLYEGSRLIDPIMVNTLSEALDLLGTLVESPESVSPDRQTELYRRLSSLAQRDSNVADAPVEEPQEIVALENLSLFESPIQEEPESAALKPEVIETAKTIRINQLQFDSLINLANELLVGVSGYDQNMGLFKTALEEMELTTRRLKDIALELETKFEVKALDRLSQHFAHLDKSITDIKVNPSFSEFDALELDRYTQLNLIIRSLNEATIDSAAIQTNLRGIYSGIGGDISRQYRVIRELQVQMMRMRMVPMSSLAPRLSRIMRDVASRLGKRVRLAIEGERIELDRVVWEKLADPFMHLVRNAIHHGVESEEKRRAHNKPDIATITLAGRREGNNIVIRFGDDGQGLDFNAIREKARKFGLGATGEQMDERQLTELIFYPGFSTKTISEISGRGVGMDVVWENVKELQGSIAVETEQGVGTTFVIRLPLTLGVVRALMVRIGEVTYGIALNDIKDIHRLDRVDIAKEAGTCRLAGATVSWYSLPALLGLGEDLAEETRPLVLALATEGQPIAISIPHITGQKEIVMKGLGTHLRTVPGLSGAAVMGDGSIVPVLNISDLIHAAERRERTGAVSFHLDIPESFTVMIVDDSISIRRVMSRLVTANGWEPVEAKDGLDAIEQLELAEVRPDCIVLDIEMPRMNGFEFLVKVSNTPGAKDIPVIMLTSRASAKYQEKAFQLGAKAFLTKPCKDEEFVETVRRLTGKTAVSVQDAKPEVIV
jgi:chemosensory pili system protein ChpA (sensor histidine kinase/response regulator)